MRFIITALLYLFISFNIFSQRINFSLAIERLNYAYIGMDNKINAFVENKPCDYFYLETDNGVILNNENCQYTYIPAKLGKTNIYIILNKNKPDTIGIQKLIVKELIPSVKVLGLEFVKNGSLPKDSLKNAVSLISYYEDIINNRVMPRIIEYRILVVRNNIIYYVEIFNNPIFARNTRDFLISLEVGDDLIFDKIKYIDINGEVKLFQPIEYVIR